MKNLSNIATWVVIIATASIGFDAVFGYDFLGNVLTSEGVRHAADAVIGLSGLYLLAAKVGLLGDSDE